MSELITVTLRIPKELLKEIEGKVEPRYRSEYIRQAIIDKLKQESSPKSMERQPDEIVELRSRMSAIEEALKRLSPRSLETRIPALLEIIASDEEDRQIIKYILENKSATTKELEKVVALRRRMILERIKAIEDRHKEKFGKSFLKFQRGKRNGKRQAWWLAEQ
nr:ribbon-helix-helix domain-containing protein [Candidatus Njordarchaeota archaeon]